MRFCDFLRIAPSTAPFGRCHSSYLHKGTREIASVRKAALLGDFFYCHLRLLGHETLRFLDTQVVDPLIERTTILGIDKLA